MPKEIPRRKKGQAPGRAKAIRRFCLECMSGYTIEVKDCPDVGCWLWPYRLGRQVKEEP